MIQRKQTLFLLLSALSGLGLLFIPCYYVFLSGGKLDVFLVPIVSDEVQSGPGHLTAIGLNFTTLVLAFITLLLYQKRELQVKLCYAQILLWLTLTLMLSFCPFINAPEGINFQNTYFAIPISVIGMVGAYLAARFIKKDIDLLKSADRIR